MKKGIIVYAAIIITMFVGEIKCIYKAFNCNWEPIGKAEVVYTIAACTGVGSIVGWFNIKDT